MSEDAHIAFNRPSSVGGEFDNIRRAIDNAHISANGEFTRRCSDWLAERTGASAALLVHSGTAALEAASIVADLRPGEEVILPSYTFVTTASAIAARGAIPVFVDVREDTLNLDEALVEAAITPLTRMIVPVHYAGVACEMGEIMRIAREHGLLVLEDAAQALGSTYEGKPVGSIGDFAALSFHETKNVTCGEGGALLLRDRDFVEQAEIVREKGTNRSRFMRGEVDKYTWVDLGSSFALSEIGAAYLWAQLLEADRITERRLAVTRRYREAFAPLEAAGIARRPIVPPGCIDNGHMFYLLLPDRASRDAAIAGLARRDVNAVFHYVPLHSSPGGRRYGRAAGPLPVTDRVADCIMRLPVWAGMSGSTVDRVVASVYEVLGDQVRSSVAGAPHA